MPQDPQRRIVPLSAKPGTSPARIFPGSLHLFTRPAQTVTRPFEESFARRYKKAGSWGRWLVAFDALAAAGLVGLAVVAFSLAVSPPTSALRVSVTSSAREVRSADLVGFAIDYENRGKETLRDATLAFAYPDAFRITALHVEGNATVFEPLVNHRVISLGDIGPGGNGTVRVSGYMMQEAGAVGDLRLDADLAGTRKGVSELSGAFAMVGVSGSALSLRWAGAPTEKVVAEKTSVYTLVAENDGNATIEDVHVFVDCLPLEFDCLDEKLTLGPKEQQVVGEYVDRSKLGPRARIAVFAVSANVQRTTMQMGPYVEQIDAAILSGAIVGTARVGTTGPAIRAGEVRLFPLPWSAVDTTEFSPDEEFEGVLAGSFALEHEASDEVPFRIPLAEGFSVENLTVRAVVSGCMSGACAWSSSARVAVLPPGPTLAAELRYYTEEGEQLGRGPLPPRVAEKTEYWLVGHIMTAGRTLTGAELVVTFGLETTWSGKASTAVLGAGRPSGTRTLRWRLGNLTSAAASPATVALGAALRPGAASIGREPVVIEQLVLRGRDSESGEYLELRSGPFTTALPYDAQAAQKGTRVEVPLE